MNKKTTDGTIKIPPAVFSRIVLYDERISLVNLHLVLRFWYVHIIKHFFAFVNRLFEKYYKNHKKSLLCIQITKKRCICMAKTEKGKSKRDFFTNVMITQTVVCALIVAFLFVSANNDGKFASEMKNQYAVLMTGDYSLDDAKEAFQSIKEYAAVFSEESKNTSEAYEEVVGEIESETVQIGGGADLSFTSLNALEGVCFDSYTLPFSIILPLDEYRVTSLFGYRISPVSGNAGIHTGIDLAADYSSAIYAAANGTVVDASYDNSYGYYVKIEHEDNYVTIYAHCSKLCVQNGDVVEQGEKIAEVGSTGDSTGNHLHFEMRKDNIRIDPGFALFADEA